MIRTREEIVGRIAALEARLVDPKTKKGAWPSLVARIQELRWVLGEPQ